MHRLFFMLDAVLAFATVEDVFSDEGRLAVHGSVNKYKPTFLD